MNNKISSQKTQNYFLQFNLFYLVGVALLVVGNITFCWKFILSADDLRLETSKKLFSSIYLLFQLFRREF